MLDEPAEVGATTRRPASVCLDGVVGVADRRLFGSFVEHLGRGVYGGVYEPGHPTADDRGFRRDVIELVRELGVTVVRYPGGNFVSGYDWRDGVGPQDERPRRLDLAWRSIETNHFGTDEFLEWARRAGVEPMLALNLGLGSVGDALQLLEYCNHPGGTSLSDERRAHGRREPYDVRLWCLGNELDGPWQLGHRTAPEYARLAARAASAMRMYDPALELVAVGSSNADMPTFGSWERTVLAETVGLIDYLSCHIYFFNDGDLARFLHSSDRLDRFLDTVGAIIADAKEQHPEARDVRISLDEWNVWNYRAHDAVAPTLDFEVAPRLLEDEYTVADAVVVGSLLQRILAHADTVSIAALAQLVNVIGPIRCESDGPAWRQTTFFPFAAVSTMGGWTVHECRHGDPDLLATVATSPDESEARVLLTNRSTAATLDVEIEIEVAAGPAGEVVEAWLLHDDDPLATNSVDDRTRVAPRRLDARYAGGRLHVCLPAVSWAQIRLRRGVDEPDPADA